jgi:hypothetical protein
MKTGIFPMEKRKKKTVELSQAQTLRQDLRLFGMLARSEEDFLRQAAELEADPVFARLLLPGPGGRPPVLRRRFQGASYAFAMVAGSEELARVAGSGPGAGEWLAARPEMAALAGRVGAENFERYFLSEAGFAPAAAAKACGITTAEAAALRDFTDAFLMAHERAPVAALPALFLRCAAALEARGGRLRAAYTHPAYFRGAYAIDGEALTRLLKSGGLTRAEAAKARALAAAAQRVSWRKAGFHKVLCGLLSAQEAYLLGQGPLKPLTQRELAARTALSPGTVSRLVASRTVLAPWGGEIRLKDLFRPKSSFVIDKIREVLGAGEKMTDRQVAAALKSAHGIRISRRSVNLYRTRAGL